MGSDLRASVDARGQLVRAKAGDLGSGACAKRLQEEHGASSTLAGASVLVDEVLELGLHRIAVLYISERALQASRERLGTRADHVEWLVGDVTAIDDVGMFDIWHDRAVFHFLTDAFDQERYVAV